MIGLSLALTWITIIGGCVIFGQAVRGVIRDRRKRYGRNPVRTLTRWTYPLRWAWYRLTPWMAGRCPRYDRYQMSVDDKITFAKLTTTYRQRDAYGDDPQRERRTP